MNRQQYGMEKIRTTLRTIEMISRIVTARDDEPVIPVGRINSDGSMGIEMITPAEWKRRRPKEMDE